MTDAGFSPHSMWFMLKTHLTGVNADIFQFGYVVCVFVAVWILFHGALESVLNYAFISIFKN